MLWTLAVLGGLREFIGAGTLFAGIDLVFPACSRCRYRRLTILACLLVSCRQAPSSCSAA